MEVKRGLAQGSVQSPKLINIYLEECQSNAHLIAELSKKEGRLLAFADDLVWMNYNGKELKDALQELESR